MNLIIQKGRQLTNRTDRQTNGRTDGHMMDVVNIGQTDREMDRRTDKQKNRWTYEWMQLMSDKLMDKWTGRW